MASQLPGGTSMQQQYSTLINPTPETAQPMQQANVSNTQATKHQSKLKELAVAKLVLGCICIAIGAASCGVIGKELAEHHDKLNDYINDKGVQPSFNNYDPFLNTGEGIWCGIWIIIAGALGIGAAKPGASRCMIKTHLAFSVLAATFCGVLAIISSLVAAFAAYTFPILCIINSLLCTTALVSMILLIVSAGCSCATLQCCCCEPTHFTQAQQVGYAAPVIYNQQLGAVVYAYQPAPVQYQGTPNIQQGYFPPGTQPLMQTTFPTTVAGPPIAQPAQAMNPAPPATSYPAPNQTASVSTTPELAASKEQEGFVTTKTEVLPPSYNNALSQ